MSQCKQSFIRVAVTVLAALSCSVLGVVAPAAKAAVTPAGSVIITVTGSGFAARFSPATVTVARGGALSVHNTDSMPHTVTSIATGSNGVPLFDVRVGSGATVTVPNVGRLAAGRYAYRCTIHPSMTGTVVVSGGSGGVTPARSTFGQPLTFPRVITSATARIAIERAAVQVMPSGPKTTMWTYGGSYPGPTIRRPAGKDTKLTFVDRLSGSLPSADNGGAGGFSVHLHGDHHSMAADGQPTSYLIRPGQSRTYDYPLTATGHPEPSAIDFYHDHEMGESSRNVWMGLEGMFIVDNARDASLDLPAGRYDEPLLLADRTLDAHNQLVSVPAPALNAASTGNLILVNGRYAPYQKVWTHRYRLRIVNGSTYSGYDLRLSSGQRFTQLGTGDGLLPRPVTRTDLPLGPGQRADVVVDFGGRYGQSIVLQSGSGSRARPIMQFRVSGRTSDHSTVPSTLHGPTAIRIPTTVSHIWTLNTATDASGNAAWTIDGHAFDPSAVDVAVPLGSTQRWRIRNATTTTHYVHLHEEQWHTVLRDGRKPPAWEAGLEDTWRLDPGESVDVAAVFTDYTGVFMIHCHMLDHEDDAMMAQWAVVRPGGGLPSGYHLASATDTGAMATDMRSMPEPARAAAAQELSAAGSLGSTLLRLIEIVAVIGALWLLVVSGLRVTARHRRRQPTAA